MEEVCGDTAILYHDGGGKPKAQLRKNYQRQQEKLLYLYRQQRQITKLYAVADKLKGRVAAQEDLNTLKKLAPEGLQKHVQGPAPWRGTGTARGG